MIDGFYSSINERRRARQSSSSALSEGAVGADSPTLQLRVPSAPRAGVAHRLRGSLGAEERNAVEAGVFASFAGVRGACQLSSPDAPAAKLPHGLHAPG